MLALGILGLGTNAWGLFKKDLPALYYRLSALIPAALAGLMWLCGCCPSFAFFVNVQRQRSDPDSMGLGYLIRLEYGFWLTIIGLGMALLGLLLAAVGGVIGLISRKSIKLPTSSS